MGVSRGIALGGYVRSLIWSIVLFRTVSLITVLSSSSKVVKTELDFHTGNSNISPAPCSKRWIAESYFEDFDTLLDSHFQDFKEHSLSSCSCKAQLGAQTTELKLSGLERCVISEGSHRQLSSSIRIDMEEKFKVSPPAYSCEVIIIERLPSGIFADLFELQHLLERGVFSDVAVFGDTDLEVPTVRSNRTVVEVHVDVGPNTLSRHKDGVDINLQIPLHPVNERGYTTVIFGEPDIFARCSIDGRPSDQTCLSVLMRDSIESNHSPVAWEVPSGIEMHAGIVSAITFLSAALSATTIILASIFYRMPGKAEI